MANSCGDFTIFFLTLCDILFDQDVAFLMGAGFYVFLYCTIVDVLVLRIWPFSFVFSPGDNTVESDQLGVSPIRTQGSG